ncbi:MAG: 4-alpha-glucanotransferase [Lachnospiraceae bacterium]|nr:4-alpha-glucanotransferase [Lachnospiraceae bacterium]
MRASGILLPVSALPGKYGIGCFSKEAYEFIDFLERAGQKYWQILPLGPTGYGDSPYQSFSTFAGNPYYIDLERLIEEGLLKKEECDSLNFGSDQSHIDYAAIYENRFMILKQAYLRFIKNMPDDYEAFNQENGFWLNDYALYMAIKNYYHDKGIDEWDQRIIKRDAERMNYYSIILHEQTEFYHFIQYEFFKQWRALKQYANQKGILIIGDLPIYAAYDSADTWSNPRLFQLDEEMKPIAVAGCPPDAFAKTGQLWGNPLYDWEYHQKTGYEWWIKRIQNCFALYDVLRIDHFRGFDGYYSIPYGQKDATNGEWKDGPGMELFEALKKSLGDKPIIAEDLGYLTDRIRELVRKTGYPGMKVIQFAFDSREESDYLPHNYEHHCVVYTGTHDNDTIKGWYQAISEADRKFSIDYMNNAGAAEDEIPWDFIRLAEASVAELCIVPLQDYLSKGSEARINIPSTLGGNWCYRFAKEELTEELEKRIRKMAKLYGRLPEGKSFSE